MPKYCHRKDNDLTFSGENNDLKVITQLKWIYIPNLVGFNAQST